MTTTAQAVAGDGNLNGQDLRFNPKFVAAGRYYIGHSHDLETRLANHNRTDRVGDKFTRKNGPWTLVWSEPHPTRSAAMQRERQIKQMKSARWIRERLLGKRMLKSV